MARASSLGVAVGSLSCVGILAAGGVLNAVHAGGGADGDYYDVTTVFVAEENYGGRRS